MEQDDSILRAIGEQEAVQHRAKLGDAEVVVTDRRVLVAANERTMLDVPIDGLRRIQFDIERSRPATLVIVPEKASHEPQVLAVAASHYAAVAEALVIIGRRLADA